MELNSILSHGPRDYTSLKDWQRQQDRINQNNHFSERTEDSDYRDSEGDDDYEVSALKKRKISSIESGTEAFASSRDYPPASPKGRRSAPRKKGRSCSFCGVTETPMWRRGPDGKGTLCNACGVKWSLKRKRSKKGGKSSSQEDVVMSVRNQHSVPFNHNLQNRSGYNYYGRAPLAVEIDIAGLHDSSPPTSPSISSPSNGSLPTSPLHEYYPSFQPMRNTNEKSDDPSFYQHRRAQRRVDLETGKKWDLHRGPNANASETLGHLLTVVTEQVLEQYEFDELRSELRTIRNDISVESKMRKEQMDLFGSNFQREFVQFRQDMLAKAQAQNSNCIERLQCIGKEFSTSLATLRAGTLQFSTLSLDPSSISSQSVLEKLRELELRITAVQSSMETSLNKLEVEATMQKKLELELPADIDQRATKMQQEADQTKLGTEKYSSDLLEKISLMDAAMDHAHVRKAV